MGSYFNFETSEPDRVNALFFYEAHEEGFDLPAGTRVVTSESTVMDDIAYISVDPKQKHLRHIKTVDDWNQTFPVWSVGKGQIKLSGGELKEVEERIIDFVIENKELFDEIEDQSGEFYKEPTPQRGWWSLDVSGVDELTAETMDHISMLVKDGFTGGEILQYEEK